MPLWVIFHPEGILTTHESKQTLAADITSFYTRVGLPPFYVVIEFVTVPHTNTFVGGQNPTAPFIRIMVDHIAAHANTEAHMFRQSDTLDGTLKKHFADKGYSWEFHVDHTPRELWKVNGFRPPPRKYHFSWTGAC